MPRIAGSRNGCDQNVYVLQANRVPLGQPFTAKYKPLSHNTLICTEPVYTMRGTRNVVPDCIVPIVILS